MYKLVSIVGWQILRKLDISAMLGMWAGNAKPLNRREGALENKKKLCQRIWKNVSKLAWEDLHERHSRKCSHWTRADGVKKKNYIYIYIIYIYTYIHTHTHTYLKAVENSLGRLSRLTITIPYYLLFLVCRFLFISLNEGS